MGRGVLLPTAGWCRRSAPNRSFWPLVRRKPGQYPLHGGDCLMRVLVTGGAGFLGRHVASGLASAGHHVVVFDKQDHSELPTVRGDLLDPASVLAAARQVEAICHLGAVGDVYLAFERPELAAAVNVAGTAN